MIRSFLVASALLACCAVTSHAQVWTQTVGPWRVKDTANNSGVRACGADRDAQGANQGGYDVIARFEGNGGYIVAFSSPRWTMNLNERREALLTTGTYRRTAPLTVTQVDQVRIDLGEDPAFIEALRRSEALHLRVESLNYEQWFAFPLADQLLQALDRCLQAIAAAAPTSRSPTPQGPAQGNEGQEDQALRRSMFRTYALQAPFAPQPTIAAATDCAMEALRTVSPTIRKQLIDIDRVMDWRSNAYERWAFQQTDPSLAPFGRCNRRLQDGEFGPTRGAEVIATAAPNPSNVPACPIDGSTFRGEELTCYCAPLKGGVAYGSRTYADISTICIAATHAGVFDFLTGGVVRVAFQPGCASYPATESPTGPSGTWGRTARSFYFPSVGPGACPR